MTDCWTKLFDALDGYEKELIWYSQAGVDPVVAATVGDLVYNAWPDLWNDALLQILQMKFYAFAEEATEMRYRALLKSLRHKLFSHR